MCDERTERDNDAYLGSALSRRRFGTMSAGAMLASWLPGRADALDVTEQDVTVATPDGQADCHFAHPNRGAHAGVIVWPDVLGLRPAFRLMGRRLAGSGYAVLTVNPYYRSATAPVVEEGASFRDEATRAKVLPLAQQLTAETNVTDARAFAAWLDAQPNVDRKRKIGTTGYCMGGPMTVRTAAALPQRIGAGASFHGGRLVTDAPDSPHRLVDQLTAHFLIAIAENDDQAQPEAKHALRDAFEAADVPAEIEVYEGAMHGWCPPDSRVYHAEQAERAWQRLLALFGRALA